MARVFMFLSPLHEEVELVDVAVGDLAVVELDAPVLGLHLQHVRIPGRRVVADDCPRAVVEGHTVADSETVDPATAIGGSGECVHVIGSSLRGTSPH